MWKCVLVGLALVLPGTLLVVEGKYSEGNTDGRDKASLLSLWRDIVQQDHLLRERYSDNAEEPPSEVSKKSKTDTGAQPTQTNDGQNGDGVPPQEVSHTGDQGSSNSDGEKQQIGLQADGDSPKFSPLRQASRANDEDGGFTSTMGFITIVAGCTVLAAVGIIGAGVCWYKYHKAAKAASDVEYPAYGVTGPTKDRLPSPGDRKLAQSAQMYHYQHQKQQMIAMEKANGDMKHDASDDESEEDNVEGDYTVYECPGLAPTGEMEVKNPLFRGDETPSTPANEEGQQHPGAGEN